MTIVGNNPGTVIGGVDTHVDVHVASVVNHVGGVLGVESFSTTRAGYRQLLGWLRSHGELTLVGVEGTGSYGVGLSRYLTEFWVIGHCRKPSFNCLSSIIGISRVSGSRNR